MLNLAATDTVGGIAGTATAVNVFDLRDGIRLRNRDIQEVGARATRRTSAAWFRVLKSDGTSALWDGSVGTSGCNLNFATVSFVANAQIDITSFTYTQSKS